MSAVTIRYTRPLTPTRGKVLICKQRTNKSARRSRESQEQQVCEPREEQNHDFVPLAALRNSTMALTESVGAQSGAPARPARKLSAPPGAHSSSSALVHPSRGPRDLVSPAQLPAQGDGGVDINLSTYPASPRPPGLPRRPRHCTCYTG
jgi:hypothetical protein